MSKLKDIPEYVPGHQLLAGKTALVTAAAGVGIGYATALKIAQEGAAALMISDIHEGRLQQAADAIEAETGLRPHIQVGNVTDEDAVQSLVGSAVEKLGRIDILVNNAGLGTANRLVDMTDEQWHRVLDVTLNGTFRMTRAVLRQMQEQGDGVIVNNASVLGWRAQPEQSHYAAAKAGVMAFTRCVAMEAVDYGVRINAVAPSLAMHAFLRKSASEELLAELESKEAFGRGAECWEVANVIVFLASDYSSYMTGEVLPVSSQHA
jgi:3-oxoacyl-[acyl-carrier protein] reductase